MARDRSLGIDQEKIEFPSVPLGYRRLLGDHLRII